MENITYFTDELNGSEHVIIDKGNGEFVSMLKSVYDKMIANQNESI